MKETEGFEELQQKVTTMSGFIKGVFNPWN